MNWLLAPDSFKGALRGSEVARAMERGLRRAGGAPGIDRCPMADGGEGTLDAVLAAQPGERVTLRVRGPLGDPVDAALARVDGGATAWIEMAEAAGLERVPEERRDPGRTTSYGVGELIRAALDRGAHRIVVGLGGSATCDGGAGLAQALGARLEGLDALATGAALQRLQSVDLRGLDARLARTELIAAADVTNPLLGERGAPAVYGPQKGADAARVRELEQGLEHLAAALPGADPRLPGAGAAGGLGFGLSAICGARLVSGADCVMEATGFRERLTRADVLLTGEGRLDGQSLQGKLLPALATAARERGVLAIALAGAIGERAERLLDSGLTAWLALADRPLDAQSAMRETEPLLERTSEQLGRVVQGTTALARDPARRAQPAHPSRERASQTHPEPVVQGDCPKVRRVDPPAGIPLERAHRNRGSH